MGRKGANISINTRREPRVAVPGVEELSHGAGSACIQRHSRGSILLLMEPGQGWRQRRSRCPEEPLSPGWGDTSPGGFPCK